MGTARLVILIAVVMIVSACADASQSPTTTQTRPETTAPETTASNPGLSDSPEPPGLVIGTGSSAATTLGFDYCWTLPDGTDGTCADNFGSEIPTPITVDTPTVALKWIEDGELSAWYGAGNGSCDTRLWLEPTGPGTWSLAMPPGAGTYRIDLHGKASQGSTRFSVMASASVSGPPALPIAAVSWPDTKDEFVLSAELYGVDPHSEALIDVVSADGITTVLQMQLYASDSQCAPFVESVSTAVGGVDALGATPYAATLILTSGADQYEMSWKWPGDVGRDDTVTGTLRPTVESSSVAASLVGAGWSFGMCGGFCLADLMIEATQASLTGRSWDSDKALFVNQGVLTEFARTRIESRADALGGVVLEPVYGCPDCADGGAAYLLLEREGITTRHSMSFGRPPEELAELYEPAFGVIEGLTWCESNELVEISDDCEPQER